MKYYSVITSSRSDLWSHEGDRAFEWYHGSWIKFPVPMKGFDQETIQEYYIYEVSSVSELTEEELTVFLFES